MTRRHPSWLVLALLVAGCAKADRAAEPAPPAQAPVQSQAEPTAAASAPSPQLERAPASTQEDKTEPSKREGLRSVETLAEAEAALKQAQGDLDAIFGAKGQRDRAGGATPLAAGDPRCQSACKAMESLRRAADAVCRLAGDGDARCARARGIVKESQQRVAACKCEARKD